jgi:CheY-like chemotaxis protein
MTETPDYSTRRFLVVDDEPFMLSMLERMLRHFKAGTTFKAQGGVEALKTIRDSTTQVDCIISDYNMKPVNGLQLLQAVRTGVNAKIPRDQNFIMLTGHGETEVVKSAIMLDVNAYLVKPISPEKLAQTLDRVFKKPLALKDAGYYRSINLGLAPAQVEAVRTPSAWVLLPKTLTGDTAALREKVLRFGVESATRDGIEEEVPMKNRRQCDLAELREDMLLGEDIETDEGAMLLRRGTRLTARMIDRLRELAVETGTRTYVWVGDPA